MAAPPAVDDFGPHAVTGQRPGGVRRGHEQVAVTVGLVGDDEAEPALVELEPPGQFPSDRRQGDHVLGPDDHFTMLGQLLDRLAKGGQIGLRHAQFLSQAVHLGRLIGPVADVLENAMGVALGHGLSAGVGFAGLVGYATYRAQSNAA